MEAGYAYIWEYRVVANSVSEFEEVYRPEGTWSALFRRHSGYVGTELHRELQGPSRYVTIDYWESKEACDDFRRRFASEFEALDKQCEHLTDDETYRGEFSPVR